jgi:hypothetical protein
MMTVRPGGRPNDSAASAVMYEQEERAAVEEDSRAGDGEDRPIARLELLDKLPQRSLLPGPLGGDDPPSLLPRGHHRVRGEPDQQRQPRPVRELGQVGPDEQQVNAQQETGAEGQQPSGRAPAVPRAYPCRLAPTIRPNVRGRLNDTTSSKKISNQLVQAAGFSNP